MIFGFLIFSHLLIVNVVKRKFEKQEACMNFKNYFRWTILSVLETIWEIEVNIVAGALPA
jgi:hypothetical protein